MKKKYPVLKCTEELWKEIKPVIESFGIDDFTNVDGGWHEYPYLISNYGDCCSDNIIIGNGIAFNFYLVKDNLQYLVDTKDEFLSAVAKLLGKEYPIKQEENKQEEMEKIIIGGVEIKPGMLVYANNEEFENREPAIVFPSKEGLCYMKLSDEWSLLDTIKNEIIVVQDLHDNSNPSLVNGKILWEKPKKVTITKQEIAEKFGIDVEQLEIKEE